MLIGDKEAGAPTENSGHQDYSLSYISEIQQSSLTLEDLPFRTILSLIFLEHWFDSIAELSKTKFF